MKGFVLGSRDDSEREQTSLDKLINVVQWLLSFPLHLTSDDKPQALFQPEIHTGPPMGVD